MISGRRFLSLICAGIIIATFFSLINCGGGKSANSTAPSGPLSTWYWRNPLPQGNPLSAITYGNGMSSYITKLNRAEEELQKFDARIQYPYDNAGSAR
jgi:hypothetical protein